MDWLLFAIAGYFFYALTNIISKVMVTNHIRDIYVYTFIASLFGLIPLILIPVFGFTVPGVSYIIIALISGMLWLYSLVPYFKALKIDEVSRVIPIWRFNPFFVLMISFVLLGEVLGPYDLLAFFLLMGGGILVSMKRVGDGFHISRAFYLTVFSAFMLGASHAVSKLVYNNVPYIEGFVLIRLGSVIAGITILLLPGCARKLAGTWKGIGSNVKLSLLLLATIQFTAIAIINYAITRGPVSLVTAAGGFQSLFVLILASLLSFKLPHLLTEEVRSGVIVQKVFAIVLLVFGSAIVILS